ncbi:MAG: hypothetical protein EPO00_05415, partial [Chloroflexota bacterium]
MLWSTRQCSRTIPAFHRLFRWRRSRSSWLLFGGIRQRRLQIGSSDTGLAGGSAHTYTVAALDGAGNASAQSTSAAGTTTAPVRTTAYAYDLADRLTGITPQAGAGAAATLTLDALGR